MDHRHFENKLLNDEQLTSKENKAFQAHIRSCAKCAALAEANLALHKVVMATPAPGFASRFQIRLEAKRKAQRRRYFFGGLILLVSGLGVLVWLALPILPAVLTSPTELLVAWTSYIALALSFIKVFSEAGTVLLRVLASFIPSTAWVLSLSLFGLLGLVWFSSIQKISRLPQMI